MKGVAPAMREGLHVGELTKQIYTGQRKQGPSLSEKSVTNMERRKNQNEPSSGGPALGVTIKTQGFPYKQVDSQTLSAETVRRDTLIALICSTEILVSEYCVLLKVIMANS